MLYIFYGVDDYTITEKVQGLAAQLDDPESLALNTTRFRAQNLTMAEVTAACNVVPFLARCRMVVIDGLLERFEPKGEGRRTTDMSEWRDLAAYVSSMPPTTALVLVDGKLSKTNSLLKKLAPVSTVQECPLLKGAQLQQWIISQVTRRGGKITPRAVSLLNELAGDNLWILAGEIEKLCLYAGNRVISDNDVREVTSYAREANIFYMVDAIVEKKVARAMQLMEQLLEEGTAPGQLMHMLIRQYRLLLQLTDLNAAGMPMPEKQKQLGVAPFLMEKLQKQSSLYSLPRLVEAYRKILETDTSIKTGKWKERTALELLVTHISS